jgi:hypothetical protein
MGPTTSHPDPRLIWAIPSRRRQGGDDSGVARSRSSTWPPTGAAGGRLGPRAARLEMMLAKVRQSKRVVFCRGRGRKDDPRRFEFAGSGYGTPVLVGRGTNEIKHGGDGAGHARGLETTTPAYRTTTSAIPTSLRAAAALWHAPSRLPAAVNQDRNVFAACMAACGDADAMVSGCHPQLFTSTRSAGDRGQTRKRDVRLTMCSAASARCCSPIRWCTDAGPGAVADTDAGGRQGTRSAWCRASRCSPTQFQSRRDHDARRWCCSTSAGPISNMMAR